MRRFGGWEGGVCEGGSREEERYAACVCVCVCVFVCPCVRALGMRVSSREGCKSTPRGRGCSAVGNDHTQTPGGD